MDWKPREPFEAWSEKKRIVKDSSRPGHGSKIGRIPIVAITAHTLKADRQKCLDAGMDHYMPKPIKPEKLFQFVEDLSGQAGGRKEKKVAGTAAAAAPANDHVFNPAEALEVVAGKKELFRELARIFLENLPAYVANIRRGIAKGDAGVVQRAVHALKGAVANFGFRRTYEAAYRLE